MGIYVNPGNVAFEMARFSGLKIEKDPSFRWHLNQKVEKLKE